MNGSERMIFYDRANGRHIDLFVGGFRMCHELPLADRLDRDSPTLPLAELLLTKLQVVQLNAKDANDIIALLLDHDVAEDDDDAVNAAYIAQLLAGDWGLWRTSRGSLERMREAVAPERADRRGAGARAGTRRAPVGARGARAEGLALALARAHRRLQALVRRARRDRAPALAYPGREVRGCHGGAGLVAVGARRDAEPDEAQVRGEDDAAVLGTAHPGVHHAAGRGGGAGAVGEDLGDDAALDEAADADVPWLPAGRVREVRRGGACPPNANRRPA